ncbi:MAG TPA: NUDIX domain-containing protein [Candidatus Saccharibacteria bacterium]|nr:NUDIX domain-containing protein [Candidatus Saccharibacteria bacterium]
MPHIHTEPGQHDMTVSAYIVREENGEWKCMVHFHKKIEKLMQIGGHIELNETPWQTMAHEIEEESGYKLSELTLLQFTKDEVVDTGNVLHPTPFSMNTHNVGNDHFHSDSCYGFVASSLPQGTMGSDESSDIRWLSLSELEEAAKSGEALEDVYEIYKFLLAHLNSYVRVEATHFSLEKPKSKGAWYKHGAPGGDSER